MRSSALALSLALLAGCVVGAPPGFSGGDAWSVPMVAPLEDAELLVPVKINGTGPYLFKVDPDSEVSSIDAAIVSDLDLYQRSPGEIAGRGYGTELTDERDKRVVVSYAEVKTIELGNLTVSNKDLRVHEVGTFWVGGRKVRGLLGRDIVADSLVFQADRDRGLVHIGMHGKVLPPEDAVVIGYRQEAGGALIQPVSRKVAKATINGQHNVELHLDLGGRVSSLWPTKIRKYNLPTIAVQHTRVDELGTRADVTGGAMVAKVEVGDLEEAGILMLPYADKRFREVDLDGTLGLNFFAGYNVTVSWHKKKFYLQRRADVGAHIDERLRRWGPAIEECAPENVACVAIRFDNGVPEAPAPAAPPVEDQDADGTEDGDETGGEGATEAEDATGGEGATEDENATEGEDATENEDETAGDGDNEGEEPPPEEPAVALPAPSAPSIEVARDPNAPTRSFDVLVEAVDAEGKPLGLPRLLVVMPEGVQAVREAALDDSYAAAAGFRVLDWSPFPRDCADQQCVFQIHPLR